MLFVLFFAFTVSALMFVLGKSIFADLSDFNRLADAKRAYLAAESVSEDVVYREIFGTFELDDVEHVTIDGITATATTTYDSIADTHTVSSAALAGVTLRKAEVVLEIGAGSSFNYGLQAGNGGISLANNSRIIGNVYSNGTVSGSGNSSEILGDVVSAGPSGLIRDITATGTMYANTIDNIEAGKDAHYNNDLGGTTVVGTRYTPVVNKPTTTFPISTTTVEEWRAAIADHGTTIQATDPQCAGGTYTIDASITIGYVKIECNLDIKETGGTVLVTLDGPVWVVGDISFTQGPTLEVDPSLGRRSVQMIADDPADRNTSSKIEIRNSTDFQGSGDSRSYIMLMSLNEAASNGGSETAIDVSQSANGSVIAYADKGLVEIGNGIDLREITGYQINVEQNTDVVYETGLASLLFTSGPGGGYVLSDWQQSR